ncbi:MAG TPA: hypothetical protein VMY05_11560 [Acidobacteriota bacterium]|nr:hypothetical protein [Acidobacteriota bacterium]
MKRQIWIVCGLTLAWAALAAAVNGQSGFFEEFTANYDRLLTDLQRKPPAELAEISDFVYQKDIATFTFTKGKLYLLRHVQGRPTTAIFVGEGNARMDVPVHTERQSLLFCSGDSAVNQDFSVCFIHMADDFDLKVRERFAFEPTGLPWRDFENSKQGEFFFKPVVMHAYDNLFQLLRSHYERGEDGYFWADFDRYVFSYDPNRPEQVIIAYEHEGGDVVLTDGAVLQRMERGITEDSRVSDVQFPTTMLRREARLTMAGLDGKLVDEAEADIELSVTADSLRFVSLFLHYNLKLDSMHYQGRPVDYHRRGDFTFIGVILPQYVFKGDTIVFRLWYHGKDYGIPLPFVADQSPAPVHLTFNVPKGYNYIMPAMGELTDVGGGRMEFEVAPAEPYTNFQFQPYAAGFDTIPEVSDIGISVNFVKSGHLSKSRNRCFIPDEIYRPAVLGAFNFVTGRLGMPPATFQVFVYPESTLAMPGLMEVSQVQCLQDETGGIHMVAGKAAARQWFGPLARPVTDREYWVLDAVPDYLSLMYVGDAMGYDVFFGEMGRRRNYVYTEVENNDDLPLASGRRMHSNNRTAKGAWILHMLRYLMYDLETRSDRTFLEFIRTLSGLANGRDFTNRDVVDLAEQAYGGSLDWFFHHWLYGRNLPEYKVEYSIDGGEDGYGISVDVATDGVGPEFRMPIIMRVQDVDGGSSYVRREVSGPTDRFTLGPFPTEPKELIFNEFFSVLSKDKVKKR